jgi:hypothetical protein
MTNYSIGHLFRWLDKLKCEKLIHPLSKQEIAKYTSADPSEAMTLKLDAYEEMRTTAPLAEIVSSTFTTIDKDDNDKIDTLLLNEVFQNRVDILITEDKKLIRKAKLVNLDNRVLSINSFISLATNENPGLVEYKVLAVEKKIIGNIDVSDSFFDSLREAYDGFNNWFARKCNEDAYICKDDTNKMLGFLYIKTEFAGENYSDIHPVFSPKKRLKVGTFKVDATGFRLGERFIKIIFDNAIEQNVDEIYVTLFEDREELVTLSELLKRWGFVSYGTKSSTGESVLVKEMKSFSEDLTPKKNYPNLLYSKNKYILPIYPQYHTSLLPDSILRTENEVNFIGKEAHRYALQKVYVSWGDAHNVSPGDIVLYYRMGDEGTSKKYSSVLTTVCIVEEIVHSFSDKEDFLRQCQNRSVFSPDELNDFWNKHRYGLKILKFIFVKSLVKRLTLGFLWDNGIVSAPNGPRPFTQISNEKFNLILDEAKTDLSRYWR